MNVINTGQRITHNRLRAVFLLEQPMIVIPEATVIGGANASGISIPGSIVIGGNKKTPADTIFIQSDTDNTPASMYYVSKIDKTHYAMPNATAPRNGRYIGAFIWNGATDTIGARVGPDAVWTTSDSGVVRIAQTTASGQAVINILTSGTATLTATLNGMTSTLVITVA